MAVNFRTKSCLFKKKKSKLMPQTNMIGMKSFKNIFKAYSFRYRDNPEKSLNQVLTDHVYLICICHTVSNLNSMKRDIHRQWLHIIILLSANSIDDIL